MWHTVTSRDTAVALGSGDVTVLATPRLIAWLEAATVAAAAPLLDARHTTVGVAVNVQHRRPTPVGGSVEVSATRPNDTAGRRLAFVVKAVGDDGKVVADGQIERVIVDRDHFAAGTTGGTTGQ